MVLNLESFGNVQKTLGSVYLREGSNGVDVCGCLGVSDMRSPAAIDDMFKAIDRFVDDCYKWNLMAYNLRYERERVDVDWTWFHGAIRNMGKVVSKAQLFMTLKCIRYNTDIRDYMEREAYEENPFSSMSFEKWREKLDALIAELAVSIAWDKCYEDGCKWE